MTEYTNIDRFNIITAMLLKEGYETFPAPCNVEVSRLMHDLSEFASDDVDLEQVIHSTVEWLHYENFVRANKPDSILTYSLSLKGFSTLSQPPTSLAEASTFGQELSRSLRLGSFDAVRGVVPEVMKMAMQLAAC